MLSSMAAQAAIPGVRFEHCLKRQRDRPPPASQTLGRCNIAVEIGSKSLSRITISIAKASSEKLTDVLVNLPSAEHARETCRFMLIEVDYRLFREETF